jgi:hypothetical protein
VVWLAQLLVALVFSSLPASSTVIGSAVYAYDGATVARVDVHVIGTAGVSPAQLGVAREGSAPPAVAGRATSTTAADVNIAASTFAIGSDEAVFWSGIGRGGDATAASWAAKSGGATLESTMASRGIQLPAWDASNPSVVSAWRQASADFASGASGNVRVLQGVDVRVGSAWAQVEYPALVNNPNVTSITSINPSTGEQVVLWTRP